MISVIIPAHNEERLLRPCLQALLASDPVPVPVEVIVVANGCSDGTVAVAQSFAEQITRNGWNYRVLDLAQGGKPGALNAGDGAARHPARVYLDADVTIAPAMLAALWAALDRPEPTYASGRVSICAAGLVSRRYARFWARLPFMAAGVPGCGLFAVNGAGRARWQAFPQIISDDTYVRLHFRPEERQLVDARYDWPIAEGFAALLKVRRRQDAGVAEIARNYPALLVNDDTVRLGAQGVFRLALVDPMGFATYALVSLAVRVLPAPSTWSRGR
jgi:glycosyltransferase involved in cell wall biosynthesis